MVRTFMNVMPAGAAFVPAVGALEVAGGGIAAVGDGFTLPVGSFINGSGAAGDDSFRRERGDSVASSARRLADFMQVRAGDILGEYGAIGHVYGPAAGAFVSAFTAIGGISPYGNGLQLGAAVAGATIKDSSLKIVEGSTTYENGQLRSAVLSEDQEVQGVKFAGGTWVAFYESGKLSSAQLPEAQEVQGVKVAGGTRVDFYKSGKLISVGPSATFKAV